VSEDVDEFISLPDQVILWLKLTPLYLHEEPDPGVGLRPLVRKGEVIGKIMITTCSAF
jgi:hypothetical protein